MKKGILLILIMMLSLQVFGAEELYVRQNSGDTRLNISSIKEISFPSGQVVITMTDGSTKTYSSSSFISLRFNGNIGSGIDNVEQEGAIVYDGVTVKTPQSGILIYSTDGCLILSSEASEVNVSTLEKGVYIVKSGDLTTKIIKR